MIEHMKNDGRLGRNSLKVTEGDQMNAMPCGTDYSIMRVMLRNIRILCTEA